MGSELAPLERPGVCHVCGAENPTRRQTCPSCGSFQRGHTLSIKHGASHHSRLTLAREAEDALEEIEAAISGGPGAEPRFLPARHAAARALARLRLLERYLDEKGLFDARGRPRPATRLLFEASSSLLRHLEALGLTPITAAKLGVDLGRVHQIEDDLRRLKAKGRRTRKGEP